MTNRPRTSHGVRTPSSAGPFLKWAGGKRSLTNQIVELIRQEKYSRYYEPFLGGGAVFFALRPKHAILSDLNQELINTYVEVQKRVELVIENLREHERTHSKEHYYDVRMDPPKDPTARAAWFIYLNRTCFNGLWRVNSRGEFNVPMGSYKNPTICDPEKLESASKALAGARIVCADFQEILTRQRSRPRAGDVVYFDPPYDPISSTSHFTAYTREKFGAEDQRRLANICSKLNSSDVHLIISDSDTEFIRLLFGGLPFRREVVKMARAISSVGSGRGKISELLIENRG